MIPRRMLRLRVPKTTKLPKPLVKLMLRRRRRYRRMHNFELDWQRTALEEQHAQGESCGDHRGARGKLMVKQKTCRNRMDSGQHNISILDRQQLHRRLGQRQRHRRIRVHRERRPLREALMNTWRHWE